MENAYICTMLKNVFNIFILLLVTTAVLSCSEGLLSESQPSEEELEIVISGAVSDILTGEPLEDIKICLHAAEFGDNENVNLVSKTSYTDNSGKYTVSAIGFTYITTCLITAEDPNGKYADSSQEVMVTWTAPNMQGNTFYVNDINFYLERNENK